MAELLYLDTARLGRMASGAQQAHRDFALLGGEAGASLYFEEFLQGRATPRTDGVRDRYPGLASWHGVTGLKSALRTLAGGRPDLPVLLASRSSELVQLAGRLLFQCCRNVLIADVGWPPYRTLLERECTRVGRRITVANVRDATLKGGASADEIVELIATRYEADRCDGLFLPAVSHDGLRMPVEAVVRQMERAGELRFVVVDGAQAFCQVDAGVGAGYCDLYLAGCHKWLGGYLPMGVGFYGRLRSRELIETTYERMAEAGDLDDPLLRFTAQLEGHTLDGMTETVNLAPLFTTHGAAVELIEEGPDLVSSFAARLKNAYAVETVTEGGNWKAVTVADSVRSGILLLEAKQDGRRTGRAEDLRAAFADRGIGLTAYDGGVVRLAMPSRPLEEKQFDLIQDAFRLVA